MKPTLLSILSLLVLFISCQQPEVKEVKIDPEIENSFRNYTLPIEERVQMLIAELTLEEKISLMTHDSKAIDRLEIPAYNWWNEGLHGVARSAPATVFPQAIGMAATFNPELIHEVATAISDEGRALYNAAIEKGIHKQYLGLTYWSPNVNIFRDPRWGRGHETYGEDPFLSGKLGAAFVKGLQGDDEKYIKVAACAKHFAVHNGPEVLRHHFDALSSPKDLYETYLPAFQELINADVAGVMCAYNRLNSETCCGSSALLSNLLRDEMGFDGYIVSDCGALHDIHANHKTAKNVEEAAAKAIKADVNVNCGAVYKKLKSAIDFGLITEKELDKTLERNLKMRFRLGMFDPVEIDPYSSIPLSEVNSKKHVELSRKVARESIVLLKNKNNTLPLKKDLTQIYMTGNNVTDVNVLMANYYGVSRNYVTILEGVANAVSPTTIVQYNQSILLNQEMDELKTGQVWNAQFADAVIAVVGISPLFEGENGDTPFSKTGGDRDKIELPASQLKFLKDLRKACKDKPLVVVVCSGSAIAMPEVEELADAIVWAWYPGEQGGNAVADVIFGDYSPSGKLPITIYNSTDQLGDFVDYSISKNNWTYKYFEGKPLYPFGYGLAYNHVEYAASGDTQLRFGNSEKHSVSVNVSNKGTSEQNETVQLYVSSPEVGFKTPIHALKAIKNIKLAAREQKVVTFEITQEMLQQIDMNGEKALPRGKYIITIGASSPSSVSVEKGLTEPVVFSINLD